MRKKKTFRFSLVTEFSLLKREKPRVTTEKNMRINFHFSVALHFFFPSFSVCHQIDEKTGMRILIHHRIIKRSRTEKEIKSWSEKDKKSFYF